MKTTLQGKQGWKQFLTLKADLLAGYDKAKTLAEGKPIQVSQGNVAEHSIRKWLSDFLPKKYGVASGYIVSQNLDDSAKLRHYDVIIYDALNSPVFWIEGEDTDRCLAIPSEYVLGVIEVKSSLTPKSSRDAIEKLQELEYFLPAENLDTNSPYSHFFPGNFFTATIFFELPEKYKHSKKILNNLSYLNRHYLGGIVLRVGELKELNTGSFSFVASDGNERRQVKTNGLSLLDGSVFSKPGLLGGQYVDLGFFIAPIFFSKFAFDIIALLNDTYRVGRLSSMHALCFSE